MTKGEREAARVMCAASWGEQGRGARMLGAAVLYLSKPERYARKRPRGGFSAVSLRWGKIAREVE